MKIFAIALISCMITACGGGSSSSGSSGSPAIQNVAPSANAGIDQNVATGALITVDGSASSAGIGRTLTYAWTLTQKPAGSAAALTAPTSSKPTFIADISGVYVASVTVNDGSLNSVADTVSITASVTNSAPVANAGVVQNVVVGTVVTLDGSTSSDANSDPLTYLWALTQKPVGSAAVLSSTTSAKPTFSADLAGTYVASLVTNDGKVNSNLSTVSITAAVLNVAPVANAGSAQNVVTGTVVTVDAGSSSDANNDPLTYRWTLTTKPAGSAAVLSSATAAKPTFTADVAGTYVASLVANDGMVDSSNASTVSITAAALNVAPVANAGLARSVVPGVSVTVDGTASTDANGDSLTFAWTLSVPPGSTAVLSSQNASKPTFTTDVAGTYVASLLVNDGKVNSAPKTVAITAVADLGQLFSKSSSAGGMQVGTFWQPGSTFSFSITNNSTETFSLTKFELLNGGTVVSSTMDSTLLSGGQFTPGENVGLTNTLTQAVNVSSVPGNGLKSVYYLTLTRTGQQFTVANDW